MRIQVDVNISNSIVSMHIVLHDYNACIYIYIERGDTLSNEYTSIMAAQQLDDDVCFYQRWLKHPVTTKQTLYLTGIMVIG